MRVGDATGVEALGLVVDDALAHREQVALGIDAAEVFTIAETFDDRC